MAVWLKAKAFRLNLDNVTSVKKVQVGGVFSVNIQDSSGGINTITMVDSAAADSLIEDIESTVQAGDSVTIDVAAREA